MNSVIYINSAKHALYASTLTVLIKDTELKVQVEK